MRAYTFTNWMFRPVQQGIQPAHAVVELFVKYRDPTDPEFATLYDWAQNHKTMICLSAGNHAGLKAVWLELIRLGGALNLPYAKFHEDEDSLGGLMTSVTIIVPEMIYTYAALLRRGTGPTTEELIEAGINPYILSTAEVVDLAVLLNNYSFAT